MSSKFMEQIKGQSQNLNQEDSRDSACCILKSVLTMMAAYLSLFAKVLHRNSNYD